MHMYSWGEISSEIEILALFLSEWTSLYILNYLIDFIKVFSVDYFVNFVLVHQTESQSVCSFVFSSWVILKAFAQNLYSAQILINETKNEEILAASSERQQHPH